MRMRRWWRRLRRRVWGLIPIGQARLHRVLWRYDHLLAADMERLHSAVLVELAQLRKEALRRHREERDIRHELALEEQSVECDRALATLRQMQKTVGVQMKPLIIALDEIVRRYSNMSLERHEPDECHMEDQG